MDFKNTIIILTSNLGSQYLLDGIDETGEISQQARDQVNELLKRSFRPEFLNRLDEIVFYKPLTKENVTHIIDLMAADINRRLEDKQLTVDLTPAAKDYIIESAYDPIYGARPLRRFLQHTVETLVSKKIIADQVEPGSRITGRGTHRGHQGGAHRRGHRRIKNFPSQPDGGALDALQRPAALYEEQNPGSRFSIRFPGLFSAVSRISNYASHTCTQEAKRSFAENFFASFLFQRKEVLLPTFLSRKVGQAWAEARVRGSAASWAGTSRAAFSCLAMPLALASMSLIRFSWLILVALAS